MLRYEIGAVAEFELRQFRNELRNVARSRVRAVMWAVSGLAFLGFIGARIFAMRLTGGRAMPFDARTAEMFTGVYLIYLGIALVLALTPGAQFASVAEALFAGTSQVRVRTTFVWLQLRAVWRTLARSFIVIVIVATTNDASGLETARMTALGFAIILIPPAYAFHMTIASERARLRIRLLGGVILALGAATALGVIPAMGAIMTAQAHGAWWPTVVALAIALGGIGFPPVADPIPELVAATRPGGVRAQRLIARAKKRDSNGGATSDWIFDLSGAWVIFSGRLATFLRLRKPLYFGLGLFGWFVAGLCLGGASHFYGAMTDSVVVAATVPFLMIVCIVAASVGRDLGAEIRNPLWWAGDANMVARLGVDSLASIWRFLMTAAFALAGYGAFGHAATALAVFVLVAGLVWLARCCGYLLFAYFPAAIDQRGAIAGLRIFLLFMLAIPVGLAAAAVGFLQIPFAVQVAAVVAVAMGQSFVLLAIAARRIDGRIEAYLAA